MAWRNLWRHKRRTWLTVGAMIFSNLILVFSISLQLGSYITQDDNPSDAANVLTILNLDDTLEAVIDDPRNDDAALGTLEIKPAPRIQIGGQYAFTKTLMLEAMVQAGAWLVRVGEDFAHSMVLLKRARNVKYGQFVKPGQTLTVTAEITDHKHSETKLKALGTVDGKATVSGRLVLARYNLADSKPDHARIDAAIREQLRYMYSLLREPDAVAPERLSS